MRSLSIFLYEWKHFTRSPFKIIAVLLFIVTSIYGLHNGADLYNKQNSEIERLIQKSTEEKETILSYYDKGEKGPPEKPWIDYTGPFWATYSTPTYRFKAPSPAIVYNIGQAEQYGFYKKLNYASSPYDADMAKEIANPERLKSGTLDFGFVVLFLLPLLALVLLYNIKGLEAEKGVLSLIYVQTGSNNWWLLSRTLFYVILLIIILFALMLYGATLTNVFNESSIFWTLFLCFVGYLLLWFLGYFFIIMYGKNTVSNSLQMMGIWLLFAFIVPASVQQWVSIEKPTNLMTEFIDLKRDGLGEIYQEGDSLLIENVIQLYPKLKSIKANAEASFDNSKKRYAASALLNKKLKANTKVIEQENSAKNNLVRQTYWFNPVSYFQNQLNHLSQTHYRDYQNYRDDMQNSVDNYLEILVVDLWKEVKVDKAKYLEYNKLLNQ